MGQRKLPALPFYTGDWRKDPGVQALSFEDRGFWIECLFLMWECNPRGKLMIGGRPMTDAEVARSVGGGATADLVKQKFALLLEIGVASKCPETGAVMSRRIVRDANISRIRSEIGALGGNPALKGQGHLDNQTPKQNADIEDEDGSTAVEGERVLVRVRGKVRGTLEGKTLANFKLFWEAFGYKSGRMEAMAAWLEQEIRDAEVDRVVWAARAEAQRRARLRPDQTPIMAQGWLNNRRFEDESYDAMIEALRRNAPEVKAQQAREQLEREATALRITRQEGETDAALAKRVEEARLKASKEVGARRLAELHHGRGKG